MINESKVNKPICIIPARAGSKRLKNKAKLKLNGKTLVHRAVEAALESDLFICIVVSSDDEEVLESVYTRYFNSGIVQPHKRPPRLANDIVELEEVCKFIITTYDTRADNFCLLIPNSLRSSGDIRKVYKKFKTSDCNNMTTVKPCSPLKLTDGYVKQGEGVYYEDGAVTFGKVNEFLADGFFSKCLPYELKHPTIEIHTKEDFKYAEFLEGQNYFNKRGSGILRESVHKRGAETGTQVGKSIRQQRKRTTESTA